MQNELVLEHIAFAYEDHHQSVPIFSDLTTTFPADKISVILGESGVGKSTLLNLLSGTLQPDRGRILLGSKRIDNLAIGQRNIALVSQDFRLYPQMTVFENIAFPLKVMGAPREEVERRVNEIAKQFDLTYLLSRKPRVLSGGQQQKVALAKAYIRQPALLLLDEPFSNLDPESRSHCRIFLKQKIEAYPVTTLLVTHSFDDATAVGDQIYLLKEGKFVFVGSALEAAKSFRPELMEFKR